MISETILNVSPMDRLAELALSAYAETREGDLQKIIETVPAGQEINFLRALNSRFKGDASDGDMDVVGAIRFVCRTKRFGGCVSQKPYTRSQAVFFANTDDLHTRVSMSFMEHPAISPRPVDYTILAYDQKGQKLFEKDGILKARQTHTFRIENLLREYRADASCGTFYVRTATRDMASLRVYGCWYNQFGMTTTHEKQAFINNSDMTVFATVLATPAHETYLVLPNVSDEEVKLQVLLMNQKKERHQHLLNIGLKARAAAMIPVSKYFSDAVGFLQGQPGSIYLSANPVGRAMYYYFIHDKRRGTWQIQHT